MSCLCLEYSAFDVGKKGNIILELFLWMNVICTEFVSDTNISPLPYSLTN